MVKVIAYSSAKGGSAVYCGLEGEGKSDRLRVTSVYDLGDAGGVYVGSYEQPRTVVLEDLLGPFDEFELKAAPSKLSLRGDESLLTCGPRIAVVGACQASPQGLKMARRITDVLVSRDVAVVSGLALGIDTVAHETAMINGGRTAGVLGTPRC